jgi:hypothetical protein
MRMSESEKFTRSLNGKWPAQCREGNLPQPKHQRLGSLGQSLGTRGLHTITFRLPYCFGKEFLIEALTGKQGFKKLSETFS